jgi:putative membrane protein
MYTKKHFTAKEMAWWTRFETYFFTLIILVLVALYFFLDLTWLSIPWTPIALIGTAVAFVIGFQNNAAYDRIWEARKIWGGIVNISRTFGVQIQDMVNNSHSKSPLSEDELKSEIKTITYRHIAWMTALRHSMRANKPWETIAREKTTKEWGIFPPEFNSTFENDVKSYISDEDFQYLKDKNNKQTALLYLQSHHLRKLKDKGAIWEFAFLDLEKNIQEMFTLQGKSERIKNFPYPRQFATLNHFFMWIFVLLLPLALIPQFGELGIIITKTNPVIGKFFVWFSVPFYIIVAWVFHTMERIGRTGENPFEGTANDVPISTIARGIEIDLRQNLGELLEDIPEQFEVQHHTQF